MKWKDLSINQRKFLKAQDRQNKMCEYLYAYNNNLKAESGIYIFTRLGEINKEGYTQQYTYVGQAKSVIDRVAQHMISFSQRIDISLKNRGLYYIDNPRGWKISVYYCPQNQLDEKEREFIQRAADKGFILYNITSGGQNEGKTDINKRAESKTYRNGLKQGYSNCLTKFQEYFDKYFDIVLKKDCYKKDGEIKEIYQKKFVEINQLLNKKNADE